MENPEVEDGEEGSSALYELTQSCYKRAQVHAALGDVENQNLDLAESLKYAE